MKIISGTEHELHILILALRDVCVVEEEHERIQQRLLAQCEEELSIEFGLFVEEDC